MISVGIRNLAGIAQITNSAGGAIQTLSTFGLPNNPVNRKSEPKITTMKKRSKMGVAILAGGLSFVGAANAIDLILNGSFETELHFASEGGQPGWYYERLVTRRKGDYVR